MEEFMKAKLKIVSSRLHSEKVDGTSLDNCEWKAPPHAEQWGFETDEGMPGGPANGRTHFSVI